MERRLKKSRTIILAAAIAIGSFPVNDGSAQQKKSLFPEIVDATHATPKAAEFFHSFLTAKSRHDIDATMNHFSRATVTYIDAMLWSRCFFDGMEKAAWRRP